MKIPDFPILLYNVLLFIGNWKPIIGIYVGVSILEADLSKL